MTIAVTDDIQQLLMLAHAPVAIGVSGGKDSQAAALVTMGYLDSISHRGPRILIHSDLGMVEWNESLPVCQRLADHLGVELVVVRRQAGGLMERWEARWASSVHRWENLETVTVVLPWSTPSMRFCTSELKTHVIAAELKKRFPGQVVVNVTGVRRDESAARAKCTVADQDSPTLWSWRPIADWNLDQVIRRIADSGLPRHQAYTQFGMSRVSCRFCIFSSEADLKAAAAVPESADLYRRMVMLEVRSTFGFQGARWLADIAPDLVDVRLVDAAKVRAAFRIEEEKRISNGMKYTKGWPIRMLTDDEADVLADVRIKVGEAIGLHPQYTTRLAIHDRYRELMSENAARLERQ